MTKFESMGRMYGIGLGLVVSAYFTNPVLASDWDRFRGPNGSGISPDTQPVPIRWSATENLKWKSPLPGPGGSSPIVVGQRVFVTCWTGYGINPDQVGDQKDLRRHLICLDRATGHVLWDKTIMPVLPEDPFSGQFTRNGYASHTPVSDGKRVYVFFGKTGVLAFDLDGKQLWQTSVGTDSGVNRWGTASSPILYKNLVIVTAASESKALVALNKETGQLVWRGQVGLSGIWSTPMLVDCGQGRTDLVLAGPEKIWGFDPDNGKLRWECEGLFSGAMTSSLATHDGVVYAMETGPKGGGMMAARAGGAGDVTKTHVVWRSKERARIVTPIYENGYLYWINTSKHIAYCTDPKTGQQVYESPKLGGDSSQKGGKQEYSSPVLSNGKIYWITISGEAFVYAVGTQFKLLSQNSLAADGGEFIGSPAISAGELFFRSSKYLYCVAEHQ